MHLKDDKKRIQLQIRQDEALMKARNSIQKEQGLSEGNGMDDDKVHRDNGAEDHADIQKEIQDDKKRFLQEREEQQKAKRESERDAAKQRKDLDSHDYIVQSDGDPSDAETKNRRNKIREVRCMFLCFISVCIHC